MRSIATPSVVGKLSTRVRSLDKYLVLECVGVTVLAIVCCVLAANGRMTYFNNYVRLADSILHGHLWIDWPGRQIDAAEWHGQHYGVDGPFPVVLLLIPVMIWGTNANQTDVAIAVGGLCIGLSWFLMYRLGVERAPRLWLSLFLFAGTDIWWCSELGDVWFLAHTVAFALTVLALIELTGKKRGWLIALYGVCATEARFTLVFALFVYAYLLATGGWSAQSEKFDWRKLRGFLGVVALGFGFWVAYNEAMWGLWYDIGHSLYYHQDSWGHPDGSPFRLAHLPYQIYSFFMRPPILVEWLQQAQYPYFKLDDRGLALTFTSPVLILVFFSQIPKRLKIAMWMATFLVAGPSFLYYLNGWTQFGMRHALDFEPFLLVLMAYAVQKKMPAWAIALCIYSALVGLWGVWFWNTNFRTSGY
jgi:hypothetical protein